MRTGLKTVWRKLAYSIRKNWIIGRCKWQGPPRVLLYESRLNAEILRAFGAKIGETMVRIHPPLVLHEAEKGYGNLTIENHCILVGNNFLDLSARVTLEEGASLAPGVIVMSHNRYNYNAFLEERLSHTCGKKDVLIRKGAGVKSGAVITMGVTVGENAVVAAGAVVNRDVPAHTFVAGVPAKVIKEVANEKGYGFDPQFEKNERKIPARR